MSGGWSRKQEGEEQEKKKEENQDGRKWKESKTVVCISLYIICAVQPPFMSHTDS